MEKVFIDPMIHSKRMERVQIFTFALVLGFILVVVWVKWVLDGAVDLQRPLVMSSIVAAALGLGYYMLKRNRRALMDRMWMSIDDSGIKAMKPEGMVEVTWPEIIEIRIGMRPSRTRTPDIMIKTERGGLGAFMRWVDREGPLPEPGFLAPGSRFYYPDGKQINTTPENSELVSELKKRVGPEKIKEGAIISL